MANDNSFVATQVRWIWKLKIAAYKENILLNKRNDSYQNVDNS